MSWTYGGQIATNQLDRIRFAIADTASDAPLLMDEEIQGLLTQIGSESGTIVRCMETILLKLARECDYTIGPEKVSASQRYDNYRKMADKVMAGYEAGSQTPQQWDPNPVAPNGIFALGMHDNEKH